MEAKRTDCDHIRQHVNKVKKYASDLQTFIGMTKNDQCCGWRSSETERGIQL